MLSIIPTPIGNKEDITLRALRLLRELDIIFSEDPQTTKKLLTMYEIPHKSKRFYTFNSFVTERQFAMYVNLMKEQHVGMVSEAGTPGLSDPAKELIKYCWIENIRFEVLP